MQAQDETGTKYGVARVTFITSSLGLNANSVRNVIRVFRQAHLHTDGIPATESTACSVFPPKQCQIQVPSASPVL